MQLLKAGWIWVLLGALVFAEEPDEEPATFEWPKGVGFMRQPGSPIGDTKTGWLVPDPLQADGDAPFPMPLNAARLRKDTEDPTRWWLEIEIEHNMSRGLDWGHLGDWCSLANDGERWRHFSIRGFGYVSKDHDTTSFMLAVWDGLDNGRKFLDGLRKIHSNLPKDAIVDETLGEKHGPIHRFHESHLERTKEDWNKLINFIELKNLDRPKDRLRYSSWPEEPEHWQQWYQILMAVSETNDPVGLGVAFYVPAMFEAKMDKAFSAEHPDGFEFVEESLASAIQRLTPDEWIVYSLTPRSAAVIPASAVYRDLED